MTSLSQKATTLLELHKPGSPVVLPTVWDAWSANLAVSAGFTALTVGSHPVSDSIGKPDNDGITFDELLARISQITSAVESAKRERVKSAGCRCKVVRSGKPHETRANEDHHNAEPKQG